MNDDDPKNKGPLSLNQTLKSPGLVTSVSPPPSPTTPPTQFPERYQEVTLLGKGGMGAVYQAFDRDLQRPCAIKTVQSGVDSDPDFYDRFIREARIAAGLNHQGIIRIFDISTDPKNLYFVMEKFDGVSLAEWVRTSSPSLGSLIPVFLEILDTMAHAGQSGLVHRDIKPDNILINTHHQTRIIDFGLAKPHQPLQGGLTQTGVIMGSPYFMSPEQGKGEKDINQASDIYSLGATFYTLLSGKPPFEADSFVKIILLHCQEPRPDIRILKPEIPEKLAITLMEMMAIEPEKRPNIHQIIKNFKSIQIGLISRKQSAITGMETPKKINSMGPKNPTIPSSEGHSNLQKPKSESISKPKSLFKILFKIIILSWILYTLFFNFFLKKKKPDPETPNPPLPVAQIPSEIPKTTPITVTSKDPQHPSFSIILETDEFEEDFEKAVVKLHELPANHLILSYSYSGHPDDWWDGRTLQQIKKGRGDRKIYCQVHIAEIQEYEPYFNSKWMKVGEDTLTDDIPEWIDKGRSRYSGIFNTKYWNSKWQKILLNHINLIFKAGFDGVVLRGCHFFMDYEGDESGRINPETKNSYQKDMEDWLKTIIHKVKDNSDLKQEVFLIEGTEFLTVPGIGEQLNGFIFDELIFQHPIRPLSEIKDRYEETLPLRNRQLPVFTMEYPEEEEVKKDTLQIAKENGIPILLNKEGHVTPGVFVQNQ